MLRQPQLFFLWNTQWRFTAIHSRALTTTTTTEKTKQTAGFNRIRCSFQSAKISKSNTSHENNKLKHLSFQKLGTFFLCNVHFFFFLRHRECNHNYSLQPEVSSWGSSKKVWASTLQAEKPFLKHVDLHSQHVEKKNTNIINHSSVEIKSLPQMMIWLCSQHTRKKATDTH